jgi:hypothetical protein
MGFARVKEILAQAVAAWKQRTGTNPDLGTHGSAFPPLDGNYVKADLLNATARGRRLIQPEVVGNARGHEANLVVVLRSGIPAPRPVRQMPSGGPFLAAPLVQEIEDWINAGCPD